MAKRRSRKPAPKAPPKRPKGKYTAPGKVVRANLKPPAGSYDPSLDAARRASTRGLGDLIDDTSQGNEWSASDFVQTQQDIQRQKGELNQDVGTQRSGVELGYQRNLADLLRQRQYTTQDYQAGITNLNRTFGQLANTQGQAGNQRGLAGGFAAQAARKRAANQAIERAPMDTNFQRALNQSNVSQHRLGQDRGTSLADLTRQQTRGLAGLDRQGGQVGRQYLRDAITRSNTLTRAGREDTAFGLDTNLQKVYQATQANWDPYYRSPKPKARKPRGKAARSY